MSKYLTENALSASTKEAAYLDYIVKRKGVLSFDPNSEAGKQVWELFDAFAQAAHPRRDPIIRLQGVEMAVEAVLMRRALVTQIFQLRRIDPRQTKAASAKRSTFTAAMSGWRMASQQLETACKMMGIEGYAQLEAVTEDAEGLKALLKKKAQKVQDADFREVADEASSTTGAGPTPGQSPEASSPASATFAASSADADAPDARPEPPTPRSTALHPAVVAGRQMAQDLARSSTSETQTATPPPDAPATDSPAILDE